MRRTAKKRQNQNRPAPKTKPKTAPASLPEATFLEHVREIQSRLYWIVGFFVVASAASFSFKDGIVDLLITPLDGRQLYYLTPAGGFGFILKICTYAGLLATIPVLIYHLYKYVEPLMPLRKKAVRQYVLASCFLAATGAGFAYLVILPAAMRFLTSLEVSGLQSMLTADAYLSFVMVYLIGTALLFQIPLVMLIINSVRTLSLKRLMRSQRYIVVASIGIAGIVSPTVDMVNQLLLAMPVVVLFQVGVLILWLQQTMAKRAARRIQPLVEPSN